MTTKLIALTLVALTACAAAQRDADSAPPRMRTDDAPTSSTTPTPATRDGGANAFAYDLYDQLSSEPGNFAYSPSSISLALAMTYGGAVGETAEQMRNVMHFGDDARALHDTNAALLSDWNDPKRTSYELRVVNRLFGEKTATFVPDFLDLTAQKYGAQLEPVDFIGAPDASRKRINAWVEDQTKDRIKDLLPQGSIDSLARLVLTNAIYFKGKWQHEFDAKATTPGDFHRIGAADVRVPLMHMRADLGYAAVDGVHVLEMPYTGGQLAMTVLLPEADDGLPQLESRLHGDNVAKWLAPLAPQEVDVTLPKFKIDPPTAIKLKGALSEMGMPLAFEPAADFSAIAPDIKPLYIDDVYHKAFVEVNEEGTEAAAATAVVMVTESAAIEPEPVSFVADHPFLFLIRDLRSGAILFVGRVADPSA